MYLLICLYFFVFYIFYITRVGPLHVWVPFHTSATLCAPSRPLRAVERARVFMFCMPHMVLTQCLKKALCHSARLVPPTAPPLVPLGLLPLVSAESNTLKVPQHYPPTPTPTQCIIYIPNYKIYKKLIMHFIHITRK